MSDLNLTLRIRANADGSLSVINGLGNAVRGVGEAADTASNNLAGTQRAAIGLTSALSGIGPLAAGVFAGLSAVALGKSIFDVNREMQSLRTSLETVTGSSASAGAAFQQIQSFAAKTPYAVKDVTEAFIKLGNYGLKPSEAALTAYGNTASAMGKSLDQMIEAVADASSGEFERLKEFGIKSATEGDNVKLTFHGVTTTVKNSADNITEYLQKIGNTDFAGGMERQSKTIDGALSNLGDSWDNLLDNVITPGGERWIASLISGTSDGINAVGNLSGTLVSFGDTNASVGDYIESTWHLIHNTATDAIDSIASEFPIIGSVASAIASGAAQSFSAAWRITKDLAAIAFNLVVGEVNAMGVAVGTAAAGIVQVFAQAFQRIKDMASGLALGIEAAMAGDLSFSGLKTAYTRETLSFKQVAMDVNKGVKDAFKVDYAGELGAKIKEGAKDLYSLRTMIDANNAALAAGTPHAKAHGDAHAAAAGGVGKHAGAHHALAGGHKAASDASKEQNKSLEEAKRLTESLMNPTEKFNFDMDKAVGLYNAGKIGLETLVRALEKYQDELPMTKLLVEQNSAADDAYFAQQLAGLGYSNEMIKQEIELQHKLNAAVAANPGLNANAVRMATAAKMGSENTVKRLADEEKAAKTYTDALQNLDKQRLEIIGSNQQIYDQGLQELQQKGLLTAKEHEHLLALYETNQMLKAKKEAFGTLITSAKSALDGVIDGTKTFAQAFTGIFDNMIAGVQNKLMELMSNNFMSGNWSGLFGNIVGLAATYIPKLFSSNNNTTPSAATTTQNKSLYGTGVMAIADTGSRDLYQAATIDSIRSFNNTVDFVATSIRQNASRLVDVANTYLSKISTQLFGESTLNTLSLFKNSVTSLYSDVTTFGSKLIGGWQGLVSDSISYIAGLTTSAGASLLSAASELGSLPATISGVGTKGGGALGYLGMANNGLGAYAASANGSASTAGAGLGIAGQAINTMGAVYAVIKLGMDLFEIAGNKYTNTTQKVAASLNSASYAALGVSMAYAAMTTAASASMSVMLAAIPVAGWIAAIVLNVGSAIATMADEGVNRQNFEKLLFGDVPALLRGIIGDTAVRILTDISTLGIAELFADKKPPSATLLTRPPGFDEIKAGATPSVDGSYFNSSANQSSSVGVNTEFGPLILRFNDFNNSIKDVTDAFLPLLKTTKAFDGALASSINIVDSSGKTMQQFAQLSKPREIEQNLKSLDSGGMIAERFGWIAETLKQTETLAGKVAGTWMQAFYSKLMKPGDGKNNQLQVFNIEAMIAATLPELTKLPLKLADLFVKSVKSVADGATQAQFEGQMNDFFTGWAIAEQGLKQVGIEINNTAIPDYLTSLTGIGFTVKESAVALVKYAQTFSKAGGDVSAAFDNAFNNIFKQAKEKAFSSEQTTGYLTSYTTLAGVANDLGLKTTNTELNTLSLSLNDVAVQATQAANDVIDHAIADNKLSNITRSAAMEQLHLAGKIDDATIAGAAYGKALADAQLAVFNNINLVDEFSTRTNSALSSVFNSFGDLVDFSNDLVKAFGDVKAAGEAWMSTLRGVYSGKELADQTVRWIQKEFDSQSARMGLKGLRQEDFNSGFRLLSEGKVALPDGIKWEDVLRLGQLNDQLNQARLAVNSASTDINTPLQKITSFVPEAAKQVDNLSNAAADAAPKLKALADAQLGVNDRLRELASSDIQNGLTAIDKKIADIIKTAADNGYSVTGTDQLKNAELSKYVNDFGKEYVKLYQRIGNSDLQNTLADIGDKFMQLRKDAQTFANHGLIDLSQNNQAIDKLQNSEIRKATQQLMDEFNNLGLSDYQKTLNGINKEFAYLSQLSPETLQVIAIAWNTDVAHLIDGAQAIYEARKAALDKERNDILKNAQLDFRALGTSDFEKSLNELSIKFTDSIANFAKNGGDLDGAAQLIDLALKTGIEAFNKATKALQDNFKQIQRTISSKQYSIADKITGLTNPAALAEQQRLRAVEQLNKAFATLDYQAQIEAVDMLFNLSTARYDMEIAKIKQLSDFIYQFQIGKLGTLSPEAKLAKTQDKWNDKIAYALANKDDQNAVNEATSAFNDYAQSANDYYASTEPYQKIIADNLDKIKSLGADGSVKDKQAQIANYTQETVSQLQILQGVLRDVNAQQTDKLSSDLAALQFSTEKIGQDFMRAVYNIGAKYGVTPGAINTAVSSAKNGNIVNGAFVGYSAPAEPVEPIATPRAWRSPGIAALQSGDIGYATELALEAGYTQADINYYRGLSDKEQANFVFPKAFANGGSYPGGLALVGEQGPEFINFDRPGQVYTAPQTRTIMQGGDNSDVVEAIENGSEKNTAELKRLREESLAIQRQMVRQLAQLERRMAQIENNGVLAGAA